MVQVTLTMPYGLLKSFSQLMESLQGFFKHVSYKTTLEKRKADYVEPAEVQKREYRVKEFEKEALRLYDALVALGETPKKAVSGANKALKDEEWPWASYDIVLGIVRKAGRFKGVKRG